MLANTTAAYVNQNIGDFIKDNMLIDPSMQQEIIRRALGGNLGDHPNQAVHSLSTLIPDGQEVSVYLRHAAEQSLLKIQ